MRPILRMLLIALFSSSTTLGSQQLDRYRGDGDPAPDNPTSTSSTIDFARDVKPILDKRCVVCHACYDAPCQLKLTAYQGITRGASKDEVYDGGRLLAANLTHLFEDAHTDAQWRQKGFFPVLNEDGDTPGANIDSSVMAQMLLLKADHPLPHAAILPASFDLSIDRNQRCTTSEGFQAYRDRFPLWGMPYGLPALSTTERLTLLRWIGEGAPDSGPAPIPDRLEGDIRSWEAFFNQDSLKAQLMSRYMYEHLFLAHLYFEAGSHPIFFQLVRSATPPGQPLQRISTRRPFDDPGVKRVYYRLIPEPETIVAKTHMPYKLDPQRMERWRGLFLTPEYPVTKLPSYDPEDASNPFITFEQLPAIARYRFMLEEARFTIMGFIKGPVCRGQVALDVINDYFWVAFLDPEKTLTTRSARFFAQALSKISLPAEAESNTDPLRWLKYAAEEKDYLKAKSGFMRDQLGQRMPLDLNLAWDGDGSNDNAALMIFRHFDSATVIKGLQGKRPQTAWLIGYPLLERIHYLLVAGFDVYGNVGHQLNSRIYMDFLRMEGEFNFLSLLPRTDRDTVREQWYRGSVDPVKEYVYTRGNEFDGESAVHYQTEDHLTELYAKLETRLQPVLNTEHALDHGFDDAATLEAFGTIDRVQGEAASILPQTTFIAVEDSDSSATHYYTLLHNNAYTNISQFFGEADRRLPEEDTLTLASGFVGAYPSVLMQVERSLLQELAEQIQGLKSESDYRSLLDRFGMRRSNPEFWAFSDAMHQAYEGSDPVEAGWFDYNRLENR
jgi:hypothetical protein